MSVESGTSIDQMEEKGEIGDAEKENKYREERKINSAHFVVEWDDGYNEYVIYFPDIDTTDRKEIPDEVIRVSDNAEDAKKVLEKAVELATTDLLTWESEDPDKDLYKEINKFITAQDYK